MPAERLILESTIALPAPRARSLAELLFAPLPGEDDLRPILLGTQGAEAVEVSLRALRQLAVDLAEALRTRGISAGDTVLLARLPRTGEAAVATTAVALAAAGVRTFLPMALDPRELAGWLRRSGARAVLWSARELLDGNPSEEDVARLHALTAIAEWEGVATLCLQADLGVRLAAPPPPASLEPTDPRVRALVDAGHPEREIFVLTTSGSSGDARLVRYREGAFLRSCAGWEAAGLFGAGALQGRALTILLAHSMGVRALWNALWTREALCLVPPEWYVEQPGKAQALLLRLRPAHVTGGPGVLRALLDLGRVFPDLKRVCVQELRRVVSSGASFDAEAARRLEGLLGTPPDDAYGTTETQQVLSTLAPGPLADGVGNLLPGVRLALDPRPALGGNVFRLHVASPYGFSGYLDEEDAGDWFDTGDLVRWDGRTLEVLGREAGDFVKDAFGVKLIPDVLSRRYAGLDPAVAHVELFPLRGEPGLAALFFVPEAADGTPPAAAVSARPLRDRRLLRRLRAALVTRLERGDAELGDVDRRHAAVLRFACVASGPPVTPKGSVSRARIEALHADVIRELTLGSGRTPGIVDLRRGLLPGERPGRAPRSRGALLLAALALDKHYHGGEGDRLRYREGGIEHEVVDFVGGFGVNLLGHRHPDVIARAQALLAGGAVPLADQGSDRPHERALADRLDRLVAGAVGGSWVVRLGSTGAEVVEMALHHAFLEREAELARRLAAQRRRFGGRWPGKVAALEVEARARLGERPPQVIALAGSYHGHSLGARAMLGPSGTRRGLQSLLVLETIFLGGDGAPGAEGVPGAGGAPDLDRLLAAARLPIRFLERAGGDVVEREHDFSSILAAFAEPIQGEGGIRVTDPDLLRRLHGRGFPLVLDEIQSGLGRSGKLLASEGIPGDYYLLGKALGGGVAKISALLVDRRRWVPGLEAEYLSTFAGDAFSCGVALQVLDTLERERVTVRARERGGALRAALERLRADYPEVLRPLRGEGLMLGVELDPSCADDSLILRIAIRHDLLGLVASSFLLRHHGLRVLPTLSAPNTLRLEPSAWVDDEAIARLVTGLGALCEAIRRRDFAALAAHLVEEEVGLEGAADPEEPLPSFSPAIEEPAPGAVRVAFLYHPLSAARDLAFVDPSLRRLSPGARTSLFQRMGRVLELEPTVAFARNLFDGRVWFASILLPMDAGTFEQLDRAGHGPWLTGRVQHALGWARSLGCEVAGLGAYTSIVTGSGRAVLPPAGMRIVSGNSLTVAVAAQRAFRLLKRRTGRRDDPCVVGVVGATGNIGSRLALEIVRQEPPPSRVVLIGRSPARTERVREQLRSLVRGRTPEPRIDATTELEALLECDFVVCAAASADPLVWPHHLRRDRPVTIADLTVPSVVARGVRLLPNVRMAPLVGAVRLPDAQDFALAPELRPGQVYTCAAEAMLIGLEREATTGLALTGRVRGSAVRTLTELAVRHGLMEPVGQPGTVG